MKYLPILGSALFVAMAMVVVVAQEKPASPPTALDELTSAWVESVASAVTAEQVSLEAVKATAEYKRFEKLSTMRQQLQADRTKKIEAKFPGFTLDWDKRVLIAKSKAPAKP